MIFIILELLKKYYGFDNPAINYGTFYVSVCENEKEFFLYEVDPSFQIEQCYFLSCHVSNCNSFVLNSCGKIVTKIFNHVYVLIYRTPRKASSFSIFPFYRFERKQYLNWRSLWIQKSDYMNSFYLSIQGKYSYIDDSIYYYLGMLETGIYLLGDFEGYFDWSFIQHREFDVNEYFNPLNLMIDVKERDFAEYLKYLFLQKKYKSINIHDLIQKYKNTFQYDLIIARLLLPNYYFSLIEDIVFRNADEKSLMEIIERVEEYELYVKAIIQAVEEFYPIKKHPFL